MKGYQQKTIFMEFGANSKRLEIPTFWKNFPVFTHLIDKTQQNLYVYK